MAYEKFKFNPEEGFLDGSFYEDTPENPREILQRQHNQTRDYINSLIDTLNSKNEGSSGSESIMSPAIEGVNGENVYEQIKDIKRQMNDSYEAVIPDSSVSSEKIKNGAVTNEKIGDKEITTEKFKEDAVCPFADEVLKINGIASSEYLPLRSMGFFGGLKELVCAEKLESIKGKTVGNIRYIIIDSLLYTLNLDSGEFKKFGEQVLPSDCKFAVLDENTIYYSTYFNDGSGGIYVNVFKYDKEYGEEIRVATVKIFDIFSSTISFWDIDVNETHFFIGGGVAYRGTYTNYYYKIPIEELSGSVTPQIYYSTLADADATDFFLFGNDMFMGDLIFENTNTDNIIRTYSKIKSCDSYGNMLTKSMALPICDRETLLPKCADLYSLRSDIDSFLYENYLYALVEGYLFKTRIF